MSFSRCLLSSALITGVVFSAATLPLATLGSKSVTIQLEEEPVFIGQVKEMAGPYLGLATAVSLGAGIVSLATAGWRQSSRKMSQTEEQMSTLKQQLQENKALIESLKYSDSRLEASGLEFFLEEQPAVAPTNPSVQYTPAQYTVVGAASAEPQLAVESAQVPQAGDAASLQTKVQATTALSSAQTFMGFVRPNAGAKAEAIAITADQAENPTQLDELLNHLKQVMSQIEQLHVVQSAPQDRESETVWQQHKLAS